MCLFFSIEKLPEIKYWLSLKCRTIKYRHSKGFVRVGMLLEVLVKFLAQVKPTYILW